MIQLPSCALEVGVNFARQIYNLRTVLPGCVVAH